jgi:aminoglycoside phosphotransferase (APT) family kinase protein
MTATNEGVTGGTTPPNEQTPQTGLAVVGLDLDRLRDHLSRECPPLSGLGPLTAQRLSGGKSNHTFLVTDQERTFVVRRPPLGDVRASHNVAREGRIVAALASSDVPVPAVLHIADSGHVIGSPFVVLEYVPGRVVRARSDLRGVAREHLRPVASALAAVLRRLHHIDHHQVALSHLGRPDGFVDRQIALWHRQWTRWRTRELPAIDELARRLAASVPASRSSGIVHGDFRFDNVMYDAELTRVVSVLDWEMASVGDPLCDLGLLLAFWSDGTDATTFNSHQRLTAHLEVSREQLLAMYCAGNGDLRVDDVGFYIALGYLKWAVIREGICFRHHTGGVPIDNIDKIAATVPLIAELGLAQAATFDVIDTAMPAVRPRRPTPD